MRSFSSIFIGPQMSVVLLSYNAQIIQYYVNFQADFDTL